MKSFIILAFFFFIVIPAITACAPKEVRSGKTENVVSIFKHSGDTYSFIVRNTSTSNDLHMTGNMKADSGVVTIKQDIAPNKDAWVEYTYVGDTPFTECNCAVKKLTLHIAPSTVIGAAP